MSYDNTSYRTPDGDKGAMAELLDELDRSHSVSLTPEMRLRVDRSLAEYASKRAAMIDHHNRVEAQSTLSQRIAKRADELFASYPKAEANVLRPSVPGRCAEQVASGNSWHLHSCRNAAKRVVGETNLCGPHAKIVAKNAAEREIRGW